MLQRWISSFLVGALFLLSCEVREVQKSEPKEAPKAPEKAPSAVLPIAPLPPEPPPAPVIPDDPPHASPYSGKRFAKVTVISFSDYQCPFCAKVEGTLSALMAKYGDDLRIVWKDNPLSMHKSALPAAIAARAVARQGNDKFYFFHGLLFSRAKELPLDVALYEQFAAMVPGINLEQWRKDIADPEIASYVKSDMALASLVGVRGIPAFFINGEMISGAAAQTEFEKVIDRQRTRAEELLAKGVELHNVYEELTKTGAPSAPSKTTPGMIIKVPLVTPLPTSASLPASAPVVPPAKTSGSIFFQFP